MARSVSILSIVAIAGWLASLAIPALSFRFDGEHDQILEGYKILTSGFMHLFVLEFSWLANFAFWFLVWCLWRLPDRPRMIMAAAALTLLLTMQSVEIFIWDRFFEYPRPYAGYYIWAASNVLLCMAAALSIFSAPRTMPAKTTGNT